MAIVDQITQQYKFLGATVMSFSQNGGNGNQAISLSVTLVEDPDAGDAYDPPPIWTPVTFVLEGLEYRGLLTYQARQGDLSGRPVYKVTVSDPREILDGVQVILGGCLVPNLGVPNLLNAYGYWEHTLGFGGALANESGMLWQSNQGDLGLQPDGGITITPGDAVGIRPALEYMTRNATAYGGPIDFRGRAFAIDFAGLPAASDSFRMGGGCRSVIELVDELCQNAGYDYQVVLGEDDVIRFRSIAKTTAPTIGVFANWAGSQEGVVSQTVGTELANEFTNAVLLGGWVQRLNIVLGDGDDAIWPYWGVDSQGNAIWGSGDPAEDHTFSLACPEIADVVGDSSYPCSIAELRAAAMDMDSWAAYLLCQHPEKAETLDVVGAIDARDDMAEIFGDLMFRRDMLAVDEKTARAFGGMNESDYWSNRVQRLYDFLARYAREYMGSKFLVRLPFRIYWKAIPETTNYISNEEISDGGYLPEAGLPLGLPFEEIDKFMTDDGRFGCFAAFPVSDRMDLSSYDPASVTVANNTVFVRATAERQIFYPNGSILPYAVVTLDQPIHEIPLDPLGGVDSVAAMLNLDPAMVRSAAGLRHGSFPARIAPAAFRPTGVAVPTKSNTTSYGPWIAGSGLPGKTYYEQDEDLTPWTYGDVTIMNIAAQARIASASTALQEVETASVKIAGTPSAQIGEALVAGGPSVTSITVDLSTSEISTTYGMQTYTPAFGAFSRVNADKLKRLGVASQQVRQKIRTLYQQGKAREVVNRRAAYGMMANTSHAIAQRSPHECLMATVAKPTGSDQYRTQVSSMAADELMANIRADDDAIYGRTAGMGMEGLLRPFSTLTTIPEEGAVDEDGVPLPTTALPHFEDPHDDVESDKKLLTTKDMNPIKDSDVDLLTSGAAYGGNLHRLKGEIDYDDARAIGLRGPVVVVGHGLELTGKPVPNPAEEGDGEPPDVHTWDDEWIEDYKLKPDKWKAGVLGVAWCKWTKTWRQPAQLFGWAKAQISNGSSGQMIIEIGDQRSTEEVEVFAKFGADVAVDSYMCVTYNHLSGKYVITSAVCAAS